MTHRLSSSGRSHTEDSVFLKPDEDPVWLDELPTSGDKHRDLHAAPLAKRSASLEPEAGGPLAGQQQQAAAGAAGPERGPHEVVMQKVYGLLLEFHCWAALIVLSQVTGYWVFFVMEGNGPVSSVYKVLQVVDFYLGSILPCNPIFGVDSARQLMAEVANTKQHHWVVLGTAGVGGAICVLMVVHMVCKWNSGCGLWPAATVSAENCDRRQSVSRQPSFTLSEWTDAQEDLLDLEPVPQTPVFDLGLEPRAEGDAATLTVTSVGLQERRGSNVSLTLDMCTPGCTEPYGYGAQLSPRDQSAKEYLREGAYPLTPGMLHAWALDDQGLQAQFYETPMNFVDPKEYTYPGLVRKNRYKTILPNTHSRVMLESPDEDDFLSTYINANYLKGYGGEERAYIATQGPTVNTVGDFWRMVWQERSPIIVMITNQDEKNEDTVTHEGIAITVVTVTQEDDYNGEEERSLRQYWYTSWPDQKTPDKAPPLLELVLEVEKAREEAPPTSGPVIVHCSAGIGRTGCFIATSILCKQLRMEGVVDILKATCQLRLDRGGMIQTCEQYQFVHHVLSLYEKQLSHPAEE
ncbi:hypothetical protein CRUP_013619 [Coryphaenoides rupestris]|nr:hypothetical protein CRUP_013619 [Coryphaenoides rupestris]